MGTSRILEVGTKGGVALGLKTYPRTLALKDHEVVLTFDDGPLPATTNKILDTLKKNCVRATFFLIGRNAEAYPELVRREIADGHTVGHHTWSHPVRTLRGMSEAEARADIEKGFLADDRAAGIRNASALTPRVPFFRFPGFADTKPLVDWLSKRDVAIFGADLWASDWLLMTPQAQLKLLMNRLEERGSGIILLHDTRVQTAAMLPDLLSQLKEKGYRIVHIVPSHTSPVTVPAPEGWSSETERSLAKIMPRLLARDAKDNQDKTPQQEPDWPETGNGQKDR